MSRLVLSADSRVLDVGAGRGWPGLRVVESTGCRLFSTDVPVAALEGARHNLATQFPQTIPMVLAAEGGAMPFRESVFDAVVHADVLC